MFEDEIEEVYAKGNFFIHPAIDEAGDINTVLIILQFKK